VLFRSRLTELAQTETIAAFSRALAARPHIAGTEAQAYTRDYVLEQMRAWGLQTSVAEYEKAGKESMEPMDEEGMRNMVSEYDSEMES
jgi:hypothetical protein